VRFNPLTFATTICLTDNTMAPAWHATAMETDIRAPALTAARKSELVHVINTA
jgi:hypothetical protein